MKTHLPSSSHFTLGLPMSDADIIRLVRYAHSRLKYGTPLPRLSPTQAQARIDAADEAKSTLARILRERRRK